MVHTLCDCSCHVYKFVPFFTDWHGSAKLIKELRIWPEMLYYGGSSLFSRPQWNEGEHENHLTVYIMLLLQSRYYLHAASANAQVKIV